MGPESAGTAVSISWPPPARPAVEPGADADPSSRPLLTTRRSLTFEDAASSQPDGPPLRQASGALPPSGAQQPGRQPSGGLARVPSGAHHVPGRAVSSSAVMAPRRLSEERQQRADSFSRLVQPATQAQAEGHWPSRVMSQYLRINILTASAAPVNGGSRCISWQTALIHRPAIRWLSAPSKPVSPLQHADCLIALCRGLHCAVSVPAAYPDHWGSWVFVAPLKPVLDCRVETDGRQTTPMHRPCNRLE